MFDRAVNLLRVETGSDSFGPLIDALLVSRTPARYVVLGSCSPDQTAPFLAAHACDAVLFHLVEANDDGFDALSLVTASAADVPVVVLAADAEGLADELARRGAVDSPAARRIANAPTARPCAAVGGRAWPVGSRFTRQR